jgi:hypothetical protein
MEFGFGSFLLAYALEREDIVVEKTKGEMMSLQAQVPQHINEKNKESKQSRAKQQPLQAHQNKPSNNRN